MEAFYTFFARHWLSFVLIAGGLIAVFYVYKNKEWLKLGGK